MSFRSDFDLSQTLPKVPWSPVELESQLQTIVDAYVDLQTRQLMCLKNYPVWSRKRRESIKELQSLEESVEAYKKNCEVAKLAGATVSLIGDTLSVVGALLKAFQKDEDTSDTPRTMMKTGQTGGLIGGFISAGASAVGAMIENRKAREVKRILMIDQNEAAALLEFKRAAESFKCHIEEIMDFNVFQKIATGFGARKPEGRTKKGQKRHQYALSQDIAEVIKYLHLPDTVKESVDDFMRALYESNDCWDIFQLLNRLSCNDSFVFPAVSLVGKLSMESLQVLDGPVSSFSLSLLGNAITSREVNVDPVFHGVVSGVSVAADLMNIMKISDDILNESPSEFLNYLQRGIKLMQDEVDTWEEIYRLYLHNFD